MIKIRDAELASANAVALDGRRDERLILAGDLHDEVLPALYKVHLMGEVLRQDLASGRLLDLDDDLPELLDATTAAAEAARRVVGDLRSARTAIRNVARAIRSHADQIESDGGPSIELSLCDMQCADKVGFVIVQVAREALVNSFKYSAARRVRVRLTRPSDGVAELTISDDGCGFDPDDIDKSSHFGLQLMAERVEGIGGTVVVKSASGAGTTIAATIPLT
jgi:signal transduction histidine kinase